MPLAVNHRANVYPKKELFLSTWAEQGIRYWIEYEYYPASQPNVNPSNISGNINLKKTKYILDADLNGTAEVPVTPQISYSENYLYDVNDDITKFYILSGM